MSKLVVDKLKGESGNQLTLEDKLAFLNDADREATLVNLGIYSGSFTPTVNLLGNLNYSSQKGMFYKVGKQTTIEYIITVSSDNVVQDGVRLEMNNLPVLCADNTNGFIHNVLTERLITQSYAASNSHNIFGEVVKNTTAMKFLDQHWNAAVNDGGWYSAVNRNSYKGGNMILRGSVTYIGA